jgi:hypothetical protein
MKIQLESGLPYSINVNKISDNLIWDTLEMILTSFGTMLDHQKEFWQMLGLFWYFLRIQFNKWKLFGSFHIPIQRTAANTWSSPEVYQECITFYRWYNLLIIIVYYQLLNYTVLLYDVIEPFFSFDCSLNQ